MLYYIFRFLLWPVFVILFRPVVYNRENYRIKGKAIYVANHYSLLDPVMIAFTCPRMIHFMAKKELFVGPGKAFFKALLAFPVNRHTADIASLKQAMEVLNEGKAFGIFPEGKRSVTGELDELEKGTAFIALKSGAPVIPLYIDPESYSGNPLRIIVGKPIDREGLEGMSRADGLDEFMRRIDAALRGLKSDLEEKKVAAFSR